MNPVRVPIVAVVAGDGDHVGGAGGNLAPFDAAAKIFGVELEGAAMLGQHPVRSDIKHLLGTGGVGEWITAVQAHPAAAAAELILVKEVVGGEQALLAVDDRFDRHGELGLAGEVREAKTVLVPSRRFAVFESPVDFHGTGIEERRPQQIRIGDGRGDAVECPDPKLVAVRQMVDAVVMIEVSVAEHDDL